MCTDLRSIIREYAILFSIYLLNISVADATHLRAADIRVERECGTLTFRITVIAYMNSLSGTQFGTNSEVIFGDGSSVRIPLTSSVQRPDLGVNIRVAEFSTTHTYSSTGVYTITYIERDRSQGVLNILNSHDVPYVTSVRINTAAAFGCNRFPVLSVIPLDRGCAKVAFFHNPGAFDPDGDSLSYEMSVPASAENTFAVYDAPNSSKFYTNFNTGNEAGNSPPIFMINNLTGLITWDAPGAIGEYNIAFRIIEWRKDATGKYVQLSITTRDMQIVIEECQNTRPDLIVPQDLCVIAGQSISEIVKGVDVENHPVKIEVFSEILLFDASNNPATIAPVHTSFVPSNPPAEVTLNWTTTCTHVRQQPYQVVFKISDNPDRGPKLVTFKTFQIRVVAPPPAFTNATLDVVGKNGVVEWTSAGCSNATEIQVWRKVESFEYDPGCEIGIPRNSGYQLIDVVDAAANTFTDKNFGLGLSPGAMYCYRLVALLTDTKSIVSQEICIGPVKRDAPVITHVSVLHTADSGKIRISWRSPFDINETQFPKPYQYEVYRADGFVAESEPIRRGQARDTTFLDENVDTKTGIYNYRVVLYSKPTFSNEFVPVDTSAVASTVRLSASPGKGQIQLHWQDSVPWSNVSQSRPYHVVYRGKGIKADSELLFYDSVNVIASGYNYIDTNVDSAEIYTYKILTRGTYGNPEIALLENFSQTVSLYPQNNFKPCTPIITIENINCDDYIQANNCGQTTFANTVSWDLDEDSPCRIDIDSYNIYISSGLDTVYTYLATVESAMFKDDNLPSFARCYKISSVDVNGVESPRSERTCNDNCPYFMLPNVFTPDNDGCNDLFTSRYDRLTSENCVSINPSGCPRFVNAVRVTIYNRWGRQVYSYSSEDSQSIDIDWNGVDNNGNELAGGIYYYVAEVDFDVLNPSSRHVILKDWVHLLR